MNVIIALALILAIFVILIFAKKSQKKQIEQDFGDAEVPDFEKDFFERVKAGEKSQQVLSLGSQQDCALIRSLLSADGIPSYVEGEHMNNIYGGLTGSMTATVAIKLFILCSDYEKAVDIIKTSKLTDVNGYTILPKEEKA